MLTTSIVGQICSLSLYYKTLSSNVSVVFLTKVAMIKIPNMGLFLENKLF